MNTRTILGGVAISTVITGTLIYCVNKIKDKIGNGYFDDIINNLKEQEKESKKCKCKYDECKCDECKCDECKCDECNCEGKSSCKYQDECKCEDNDCECKKYPSGEIIKTK
tara:strand:+ start:761 stop:1093 length:333 start_codon:yes stop_codon:yes gene_type:complete